MSQYTEAERIKKRVQNGIDFLDEHIPDWRDKVNVETLVMKDGLDCIIGQVFNLKLYEEFPHKIHEMNIDAFDLGFDAYVDEYEDLTREWRRQLDGG